MENNEKLVGEQEKNADIIEMVKFGTEIQLYRRRWTILAMFMVFAIASGVQWMQYTIIANFVMKFYQVEAYMVEWTSMFFMMSYILLTFPGLWFLDKTGNRISILVAAGGICIGSWIKLFAVQPDRFVLVMIGQAVSASSAVLTFGLAGSVTASWFGAREIASAGSLAVFGDLFGAGTGFLWPPLFVNETESAESIGRGLQKLCLALTIFSTCVFFTILLFFRESPKKPPSKAQIVRQEQKKQAKYVKDFVKMLSRKSFLLLLLTIGIHFSVFCAHATLLNRIFIYYFPGHEKDGGIVGCLIFLCGLIGVVGVGLFVDWTHFFKETVIVLCIGSSSFMTAYIVALHFKNLILVYVFACSWGVFMWGYWSATLQLSFELVHPYSEGSAAGLALFSSQLMAIFLTPIYRQILERFDPLTANISLIVLLIVGILLSLKIPAKYRRQQVEHALKFGESAEGFLAK